MEDNSQVNPLSSFKQYTETHEPKTDISDISDDGDYIGLVRKSGRHQHQLAIMKGLFQEYINIDFLQYGYFYRNYGIFSYSKNYVEVEVEPIGSRHGLRNQSLGVVMKLTNEEADEVYSIRFGDSSENDMHISIGSASDIYRLMIGANADYVRARSRGSMHSTRRILYDFLESSDNMDRRRFRTSIVTIKIENVKIQKFETTQKLVEDISNSCFFYLSRKFSIDLELATFSYRQIKRQPINLPKKPLPVPVSKYQAEATSFYRYGLSARNMPLLQFLAFYQVVEFFFEEYSMSEIQELAANHLKDPNFSPYKKDLVLDLINRIKNHRASDTARNEREQLATVLKSTIGTQEIVDWAEMDKDRSIFFKTKDLYKKTSDICLNLGKPDDLISQITNRVYDIRCKIVHSKASGTERDFILPYSEEITHLSYDIDLMREIAERVLIASSKEMPIQTV